MRKVRLLIVLLLASSPVWAKKNPPRPFSLPFVVNLNGAQVPAGSYELTWEPRAQPREQPCGRMGDSWPLLPARG